jgi:hypothetical protein
MSTIYSAQVTCSVCGHQLMVEIADSLNANRMPAAREHVLARTLFDATCECGRRITAIHKVLYVDFERGLWIQVANEDERPAYTALEPAVLGAFAAAFDTERFPKAIAALAALVRPRLVFGYEELREKVIAAEAGLEDSLLEALKLELLVARSDLLTHGVEVMMLRSADDRALHFDLYASAGGEGQLVGELVVARSGYEGIVVRRAVVAQTHPGLFTGPYVNIARYRFAEELIEDAADVTEAAPLARA